MAQRIRRQLPELYLSLQLQNRVLVHNPSAARPLVPKRGSPLREICPSGSRAQPQPSSRTLSLLVSQSSLKGSTFPGLFDRSLENTGPRGRRDEWAESHSPSQSGLQSKHCLLTLTRSENGEKEKKREKQMHRWHGFQLIVCHESKSQLPC